MKIIFSTLKKILFWSYERGTWQYDVMCVLILAFIFLGPNYVFHTHSSPTFISQDEVGQTDLSRMNQEISHHLSEKYGYKVSVSRVEKVLDSSGAVKGYLAWEE